MRVLAYVRYGKMGASSRLRTLQYRDHLAAGGIRVAVSTLFRDRYVASRFSAKWRAVLEAILGYSCRLISLLAVKRYDIVWIEKELFPYLPAVVERLLRRCGVRYIVDYDDAVFHRYDCHRFAIVRRLLGRKIDSVMRSAAIVVAGNEYLAQRARSAGAREVVVIPTVVDLRRYATRSAASRETITVGWIGSPSTARNLDVVRAVLLELSVALRIEVKLVGINELEWATDSFKFAPWSESEEAELIRGMDIGIMPLFDEPFERGKCGYKLIQYMACGLPVVASPVGANKQIVEDHVSGFLASTPAEWKTALTTLIADPSLRTRMGARGRGLVEARYSLQVTAPALARVIESVAC